MTKPIRDRLDEILNNNFLHGYVEDLPGTESCEEARSAILQLMREIVPERMKYDSYGGAGYNQCIDELLDRLKEMENTHE